MCECVETKVGQEYNLHAKVSPNYDSTYERPCKEMILRVYTLPLITVFDCGALSSPENGTVLHPETTFGFVATYSCEEGFSLTGPGERTCMNLGIWSGEDPQCICEF